MVLRKSGGGGKWEWRVAQYGHHAESIDPRPYRINLPIFEVDLHCNLYQRLSITNSRQSESPLDPPHQNCVVCYYMVISLCELLGVPGSYGKCVHLHYEQTV
jgi:hypothetical protein